MCIRDRLIDATEDHLALASGIAGIYHFRHIRGVHQLLDVYKRQGVESAHKSEEAVETGAYLVREGYRSHKLKPVSYTHLGRGTA